MKWRSEVKCIIWDRALTLINNTGSAISVHDICRAALGRFTFVLSWLLGGFLRTLEGRVVMVRGQVCGFPWGFQRHPRSVGLEAALDKRVAEKLLGSGPPFLFQKDLVQEVPACVRHTLGQVWLSRLGCDLENGCHCFIFSPRGLLGKHLYNRAGNTPEEREGYSS